MNLILAALGFGLGMLSGQGGVLVAWEAHLGGFVFGLLVAPLLPVRYPWRDMVRAQPERP
jgi:rhomboid protease GluP